MIGTVVGNYRITQKIGEGGMGAVFKGIDLMLEREVAIKMLRPELASQPDVVERFRSEAITLAKLNHPNIATLYAFLRHGNDFFMVMEYVQGYTLDNLIRRNGAMPVDHAVTLFCQALEGIGRAHKLGIVHRDIKPANVMLTSEDGSIKVMDFGIARVLGTARMTRQGNIVGTIEYMSPEAIKGEDADARTDIYSLGILLFEMLTGRLPFISDTEFGMMMAQIEQAPPPPTSFAPHVPMGIERAIMRALAKKAGARFQTASEFREALQTGLQTAFAPTRAMSSVNPPPPTRVAPGPSTPPQSYPSAPPTPSGSRQPIPTPPSTAQPKETRMGNFANAQPPPQYFHQPPQPQQQHYAPQYPAAPSQPSFFSRLSWVHYTGLAILLAAVIGIPIFFLATKQSEPRPSPPPTTQPAPPPVSSTPAPPPSSSPSEANSGAPSQPSTQPKNTLGDSEISTGSVNQQPAGGRAARQQPKKKPEEDLSKRRKEARKLLDQ
jgi:serine/threonine-protein kinase